MRLYALVMAATSALFQVPSSESRLSTSTVHARGVPGRAARVVEVQGHAIPRVAAFAAQPGNGLVLAQDAQGNARNVLRYYGGQRGQNQLLAVALSPLGHESDGLGATLAPVEPALRKQLKLAEGHGVLVTSVAPGGPAERVQIEPNDILLSLERLPIAEPGDLAKQLKAVGEKPVTLTLLRKGESIDLKVKPTYRVTLVPVEDENPRYVIGVQASLVDDALRSHIKLGDNGLIVNEVIADSPAAKAGLEVGDILLQVAGMPLADVEGLMTTVQSTGPKETDLVVLRAGKEMILKVTPAPRPPTDEPVEGDIVFNIAQTNGGLYGFNPPNQPLPMIQRGPVFNRLFQSTGVPPTSEGQPAAVAFFTTEGQVVTHADAKIDALAKQVEELRKAVEDLKAAVEKK